MTQQQRTELDRAIEIARENGHKVFTATHNLTKATVYTVRSHSDPNMFHVLYIQAGRIVCDCQRHQHGHICSHAAAVRLFLIAQRDALAAIEQQEAQQLAESSPVENTPPQTISYGECKACAGTYAIVSDDPDTQHGLCNGCFDDYYVTPERQEQEEMAAQGFYPETPAEHAAKREAAVLSTDQHDFSIYR